MTQTFHLPDGDEFTTVTDGSFIRSRQSAERFSAFIGQLEQNFLQNIGRHLPPILTGYPPFPSPLPQVKTQVNFQGWSYRCYHPGIYHAWPIDPLIHERIMRPWMALFDHATRQMIESLHTRAGPLMTGAIFCVGRIGDGETGYFFADAITAPLWFSSDPNDFEFVPIVSLLARQPLTAFLISMVRAHGMNGRMSELEYWNIAGEGLLPEREITRSHAPGWVERIGTVRTEVNGQEGPTLFLESGWIPEKDHPTFTVTPEMCEPAQNWPIVLKREHILAGTA